MLNLSPPMFKPRPRRRRQIQTRNGRTGSQTKRKGSTSQQDENPLESQINGYSGPNLPEDIWCYIHSLMSMRDAAKVACVSRAFVHSWRRHPDLHFSKETLGLDENACQKDGIADFDSRVDSILKKHSGIGLKAFRLDVHSVYDKDRCHLDRLDSLLEVVVKPGIEELDLILTVYGNYNFPCALLSGGTRGTLRYLSLASCQFHPTVRIGCLTSLTTLNLTFVHIEADELWCLLSSSPNLERFELRHCDSIVFLKIPCLQQLNYLEVVCSSNRLRAIESKAPNLSSVKFVGDLRIPLSLENTNRIKILDTHYYCSLAFYARADLPSTMPNLEALTIRSDGEVDTVPMVPSKFLYLKYLSIAIGGLTFDYLSLVSFLDAAPSLETFILEVIREFTKERITVLDNPSDLRVIPGHHHSRLKHVKIIKFVAAKTLAELTCQILKSATSLECLTLDTTNGHPGCSVSKTGKCVMMSKDALVKAHEGVLAAQTCIRPKVPSTVGFSLLEPCSRCHAVGI
ncbi:hypothetical protein BDA96_07G024300 [Sorghum bicolor]|uniref:At1g61320/AtMIF1 LRR domain-containing protein n=2 Tax=Sorghum bicolor TaxID=4558 RepID=A0A921QHZ6_SORBI|nr:uncharacterized protein LOC8074043 [Sorghum bicolor]KAG0522288.1 hypothetical protein BDA96_07G024300 [Sorghum bicolor]KXG24304.1 hypothetical protein SORBI_3007G023200 [Sorghum bicolor]|eukprot:XP_021321135.1 uncharacterized protein LOC8074043 [Sorghum bicolor]